MIDHPSLCLGQRELHELRRLQEDNKAPDNNSHIKHSFQGGQPASKPSY